MSDNEKTILEFGPSLASFVPQIILGVLLLPLFGIGAILLLNVLYQTTSVQYRLTDERLFCERGVIGRRVDEIELYRIKDVTYKQTVLQRMFGVGSIILQSTDSSTPVTKISGISEPFKIKEILRNQYRKARKRENVSTTEFIRSA